jgi:type III pantothenate kinase
MTHPPKPWLALAIGNSRLHWASFENDTLQQTWQTRHLEPAEVAQLITHNFDFLPCGLWPEAFPHKTWEELPELWIISVVPQQTQIWQRYKNINWITLAQIPIAEMYSTFGIDRAIALWGALITYGSPVLVIDGGTALTVTGAADDRLVGGAILPGLQLQFRALGQATALPQLNLAEITAMPPRWATDTPNAIRSGVIRSVIAGVHSFIQDWLQNFPASIIIFTGGDGAFLHQRLQSQFVAKSKLDQQLIFWGMRSMRQRDR